MDRTPAALHLELARTENDGDRNVESKRIESLAGSAVLGVSDNTATVAYTNKGHGSSTSLMALARDMLAIQLRLRIELLAVHLPGKRNELADALSRAGTRLRYDRSIKSSIVKAIEGDLHTPVNGIAVVNCEHPGTRRVVRSDAAYNVDTWACRGQVEV